MTSAPPQIPGLRHVRRLGHGGFADVHLYEQDLPRMLVAVKVLRRAGFDLREQLVAEANTMAELAEHPYIATILRAGVTEDERPYLVMSYYPRPNLAERVRQQPLTVPEALRTGIQIASAVETAHRAGILHRDIKPANILVSSYGSPALADFGIAGRSATVDDHDEVGVSVAWTSPEVLSGVSNGSVVADVYSLSATISYLLTGRTPFEIVGGDNSSDALLRRTMHEAPTRTDRPDAPASLERLLQQGMAKEPAHRPASALEFARGLVAVEQEQRLPRTEIVLLDEAAHQAYAPTGDATTVRAAIASSVAAAGTPPSPAKPRSMDTTVPLRRRRWVMALGGVVAAAALVGGGIAAAQVWGGQGEPDPLTAQTATAQNDAANSPTGAGTDSTADSGSDPTTDATTDPATGQATNQATDPAPADTGTPDSPGRALDPCLVGSWRSVEYREAVRGLGEITMLDRSIEIADDGTMVIAYDNARAEGGLGLVFDGEVEYRTWTNDDVMSFELVRNDATLSVDTFPGVSERLNPSTRDARYTCEGDTFTQEADGFSTTNERVRLTLGTG